MKRTLFVAAALAATVISAPVAGAQDRAPRCQAGGNQIPTNGDVSYYTADACEKAVDLFNYMAPQLGTAIAGGSAVMGRGGALGGLPHFSVGFRVNALNGTLPQIDEDGVRPEFGTSAQRDNYRTESQVIPMPVLDAALGVFKGIPVGVSYVGGIDLLANLAYMPDVEGDDVSVTANDGNFKFGYGARLGLLQETLVTPGVAVSYIRRDLPVVNVAGQVDDDSLSVNELDVQTSAWRLTASKSFMVFGFIAGVGQDRYDASAGVQATVNTGLTGLTRVQSERVELEQTLTRTNFFGGLTLNLAMVRIAAEVGQVSGGEIRTYNSFDEKADKSRVYGSLGIRFGF